MGNIKEQVEHKLRIDTALLIAEEFKDEIPTGKINDERRRDEFEREYDRLVLRCGAGAMENLFSLYLLEQYFEEGDETPPSLNLTIHHNTAEIIARLTEKGWANVYLSKKVIPIFMTNKTDKDLVLVDHGIFSTKMFIGPLNNRWLKKRVQKRERLIQNSTLVDPDVIRHVFAKIDEKWKDTPSEKTDGEG